MSERPADLEALYDQYGIPLEGEHWGEYVAIAYDGRTILGLELHEVARQASAVFWPRECHLQSRAALRGSHSMTSRLVSPRFPYIPLRLEIGGTVTTIEALLDTSFDGDILAPADVLQSVAPEGEHPWTLADRSLVFAPYAFGVAEVPGVGSYDAMVTFLGDEYLVGLGIVRQLLIALDHG